MKKELKKIGFHSVPKVKGKRKMKKKLMLGEQRELPEKTQRELKKIGFHSVGDVKGKRKVKVPAKYETSSSDSDY